MENHYNPEKPVGRNAKQCIVEDKYFVIEILQSILKDTLNLNPSYGLADYTKDTKTLRKRIRNEGISFATHVLPAYFSSLVEELEGGKPDYRWFRKSPVDDRPVFLHRLVAQVLDHEDGDKEAFHSFYMVCHAFKKLKGPYPQAVLRNEIRKFIDTDKSIGRINFNTPILRPILHRARKLINTLFEEIDEQDLDFVPRPGPGATNTPLKPWMRYEPHTMYSQLEDYFPVDGYFYSNLWDVVERAREYISLARADYPTSRFKFIHKYRGKPRGICIEENETQYCQQGVKRFLYKHIEGHPMTRGRVCFTDQSVNQRLALSSSTSGYHATIDMSEASDRVSRDLVFSLFRDTPILKALDAVSTRFIQLPSGLGVNTDLMVHKYAPMGSGVCFPVMALVHFALCRAIVQETSIGNATELARQVYVYGDDIIVPTEVIDMIYSYLPLFGMKLNVSKSFSQSMFRESCGIHAYKGKDVTPVYVNHTLNSSLKSQDSNTLLSMVAKEYSYYKSKFYSTARVIREHICKRYGQLPYGNQFSGILCWKREHHDFSVHQKTYAQKVRYNKNLHRLEYLLRVVQPRNKVVENIEGSRAYLRWLLTKTEDSSSFRDSVEDLKVRRRWVPESALG